MSSSKTDTKKTDKVRIHRKVHAHVRHHYFRIMPNKKHHRVAIWAVFFISATMIALQMIYPFDHAMPLARLGNTNVGWWTDEKLAGELAKRFDTTSVSISTPSGKTYKKLLKNAGAEQQASASIQRLNNYPYWQRFIPFSITWQVPRVDSSSVIFSPSIIVKFSNTSSSKLSYKPTNASLAIKNGQLVAVDDKNGQTVLSKDIRQALETHHAYKLGTDNTVTVVGTEQAPKTTSTDFYDVRVSAERALDRKIQLKVADKTIEPTKKERAQWLEIASDKKGTPSLVLNQKALKKYLATLNTAYGTPAGTTKVSIINGVETGRDVGKIGQKIDQQQAIDAIRTTMLEDSTSNEILLSFVSVKPSVIYNGQYTATEEGLRVYVRDQTRDGRIAISIKQLSGNGWTAQGGADVSRVSASDFKLYVALYLFDQMNKGNIHWDDPMMDTTVSGCFDRMTIASTNPCAYSWLDQWGRSTVNDFDYKNGFSHGTTFTNPIATHTTANDLLKFMTGLEDGSLIGGAHRDRLLHSLHVHPYRYGIPTGSSGDVYDKVGFLWDYVNDAAIVRRPEGTYIMTVMTKGYSYAKIASITREVEKIMYP